MSADQPAVRYRRIDRSRVSAVSLDEQLPHDHPARLIWDFVGQLDLAAFETGALAVVGHPGAPRLPVQLLFALWLLATTEGLASARELAQRCTRDLPYQWLCGGLAVNYHSLADFYADHAQALQEVFVEHLAALRAVGLVALQQVTLDGRKVHAHASQDHYHREPTLQRHLDEARRHLEQLDADRAGGPARTARQHAARCRAARERTQRLEQAVAQVRQRQQQRAATGRKDSQPEQARASETDPDCAKMKFPDGGYAQAYNVQTVTDVPSGLIVTVAVVNQGSDNGLLAPLVRQAEQQQHSRPRQVLADSGFVDQEDIQELEKLGIEVLLPPKNEHKELSAGKDPYAAKRRDSQEIAAWRARMGTAAARSSYRRRAPVAEGVHAQQANRGWRRFRLRGLAKVRTEAWWQALAHNVRRLLAAGLVLARTVRAVAA